MNYFADSDHHPSDTPGLCFNCSKVWDMHSGWLCYPYRADIFGTKRSELPDTHQFFVARMIDERIEETKKNGLSGNVMTPEGRGVIVKTIVGGQIYNQILYYSICLDGKGNTKSFYPYEVKQDLSLDITKGKDWIKDPPGYCPCGTQRSVCKFHG